MEYVLFGMGYMLIGVVYTILIMRYLPDCFLTPTTPSKHDRADTGEIFLSVILWPASAFIISIELLFMVVSDFIIMIVTSSKHKVTKPNDN